MTCAVVAVGFVFAVLGGCASICEIGATGEGTHETMLFDGATLDGWVQRGGGAVYLVQDGTIVGESRPNQPNSFLCTVDDYSDFVLELEFNVDEGMNSGIQIRSASIPEYRKGAVHGYQVEIDPSERAWTGGIYDESRRGWLNDLADNEPARKAFVHNDWNHFKIVARGGHIQTWLNGVAAADLVDDVSSSGFIALQVHGVGARTDPLRVRWRNIRLRELGAGEDAAVTSRPR
jgi:uncharacterized protein YceK